MLFFRAENDVEAWCAERDMAPGPLVSIEQLWGMATAFYGNRLEPHLRRLQADEVVGVFAGLGLHGSFWDPQATWRQ